MLTYPTSNSSQQKVDEQEKKACQDLKGCFLSFLLRYQIMVAKKTHNQAFEEEVLFMVILLNCRQEKASVCLMYLRSKVMYSVYVKYRHIPSKF